MTTQLAIGHDTSSRTLGGLGVLVLLAGPFLANLDFFITNVALPTIQRDLHADAGVLALIVAGYGTAYAVVLVTGGRLGDDRGRRRIFAIGVIAFTLTSLAAGLAPNVPVLLVARILQGASAALMTPQTLPPSTVPWRGAPGIGRSACTPSPAACPASWDS